MSNNKGFTLVELMIAAYLLLVGICGILLLFVNSMSSAESSWDTTVASSIAENVLEEMQNQTTLDGIITYDWTQWIADQGLNSLPEQKVEIVISDASIRPAEINVTVEWKRKNAMKSLSLQTKLLR